MTRLRLSPYTRLSQPCAEVIPVFVRVPRLHIMGARSRPSNCGQTGPPVIDRAIPKTARVRKPFGVPDSGCSIVFPNISLALFINPLPLHRGPAKPLVDSACGSGIGTRFPLAKKSHGTPLAVEVRWKPIRPCRSGRGDVPRRWHRAASPTYNAPGRAILSVGCRRRAVRLAWRTRIAAETTRLQFRFCSQSKTPVEGCPRASQIGSTSPSATYCRELYRFLYQQGCDRRYKCRSQSLRVSISGRYSPRDSPLRGRPLGGCKPSYACRLRLIPTEPAISISSHWTTKLSCVMQL